MSFSIVYKQIKKRNHDFSVNFFFQSNFTVGKNFLFCRKQDKRWRECLNFRNLLYFRVYDFFKQNGGRKTVTWKTHNSLWRNYRKYEKVSNNLSLENSENW